MKKILASVVVLLILVAVVLALTTRTLPGLQASAASDAATVSRGAYVARVADCAACHTAINGKAFAGGLKIASPVGTIFSTNITPDKATGIGNYSLADFDRAVRQGVRKDGTSLYPAMPYASFARMTDADIEALYAYFEHGVPAVDQSNQREQIPWPLSMRWPLALWRGLFAPAVKPLKSSSPDPDVARGEYLVVGPGHCGACHTPRGVALQEKALDNGGGDSFLAGGTVIDNWYVPSLRGDDVQGLGRWSENDIVTFLQTGRTDHAAVFGGMADVVAWSTQYYNMSDLRAIAKYLKTLPPVHANETYVYDDKATALLNGGDVSGHPGAAVYLHECAICHRNDGAGIARMFPPLAGNPVVVSTNPVSIINLIAHGAALPASNWAPSNVAMPAYADHLSDQQIADVTNFIRSAWGNQASTKSTAASVAALRKGSVLNTGGDTVNWRVMAPQPYGEGWTFSPQTHTGADAAQ